MKYDNPKNEDEILPNKLGLIDSKKIGKEEYRGFLRAEIKYESEFDFEIILENRMNEYIAGVQAAADRNYEPMKMLFRNFD